MDKVIKDSFAKAFSDKEIKAACDGKVRIIQYKQLAGISNIDQILNPYGACIILYTTDRNYGHWVTLLRQASGKRKPNLEHFDSYGFKPDDELKFVPDDFKAEDNEDFPYLTRLLYQATLPNGPYNQVTYNEHKLQKYQEGTSTCGRWAAMRVILKDLTLQQFIKLFTKQHFSPDWYVTAMTLFL